MCYNGHYNRKQGREAERILKDGPSSDCSLQLENMKLESLVIADQHAAVNMYPDFVLTARHTLGMYFARSTRMVLAFGLGSSRLNSNSLPVYHGWVRD